MSLAHTTSGTDLRIVPPWWRPAPLLAALLSVVALLLAALAPVAQAKPVIDRTFGSSSWRAGGIAVDQQGYIYATDLGGNRVIKLDPEGNEVRAWGSKGSDPGQFNEPHGIDVGPTGEVYVVDRYNHRVQVFDSDGGFVRAWGREGKNPGEFSYPEEIVVAPNGLVFVSDTGNSRVEVFDSEGNYVRGWGSLGDQPGQFWQSEGIDIGPDGLVYVADLQNARVQVFDQHGNFVRAWSTKVPGLGDLEWPDPLTVRSDGAVFVSDAFKDLGWIYRFDLDGGNPARWTVEGLAGGMVTALEATDDGRIYLDAVGLDHKLILRTELPTVSINTGPSGPTNDKRPAFTFSSQTENVRFHCAIAKVDEEPQFEHCGTGSYQPAEDLDDGGYIFRVKVVDEAGDFRIAEREFSVDTVPPEITLTKAPRDDKALRTRSVEFAFEADKADVEFECRLDDGEWQPCSSPTRYAKLADGRHAFEVRGTDAAGNQGVASRAFWVDATACELAASDLKRAQAKVRRARKALGRAQGKARALKRRGAPAAKLRRAKRQLAQARKALGRARAQAKQAQKRRRMLCA